jgi:hypothetical protein
MEIGAFYLLSLQIIDLKSLKLLDRDSRGSIIVTLKNDEIFGAISRARA